MNYANLLTLIARLRYESEAMGCLVYLAVKIGIPLVGKVHRNQCTDMVFLQRHNKRVFVMPGHIQVGQVNQV